MTDRQATPNLPAVQAPKRRQLKAPECRPSERVNYQRVMRLGVGKSICDPQMPGLSYHRQPGNGSGHSAVYAKYRWTDPLTKKRNEVRLGKVPNEEECHAMYVARSQEIYETTGENPVTVVLDGDALLETFRAKARTLRGKVLMGLDPRNEAGLEGYTLRQLRSLHIGAMRKAERSERSIEDIEYFTDRFLSDWLDLPARRLTRDMIEQRHTAIGTKSFRVGGKRVGGKVAANKTMRYLRALSNEGRARDETLPAFPRRFPWYEEKAREAAIPLERLPQWFGDLAVMSNEAKRDYYLLGVLTGIRRDSLSSMRAEHVNLEARTVHVPKPKGGEKRAYTVPLSDAALTVVKRRLAATSAEEGARAGWLYPAQSKSGHIEEPRPETWDGITVPFTVHGLRHTYISAAHDADGISTYRAKQLANHKVPKSDVHGSYSRKSVEALREPQQRITDYLREQAGEAWCKLGLPA